MVIIIKIINYDIIKENLNHLPKGSLLVLKDDAYGCGLKPVLDLAYNLGFRFFCVLKSLDANYITSRYQDAYVLILGKEKTVSSNRRIILTVEDFNDLEFCKKYNMPFHYKLKSKMNRFGSQINKEILKEKLCIGLYSHIGYYEEDKIKKELNSFMEKTASYKSLFRHIGGSHLLGLKCEISFRVGMRIYDGALCLVGKIIKCFMLKRNETLGYNDSYIAKKDIMIGILDIGYNSGLSKSLHHKVYIKGSYYKMVGIKCMDFSFIEINDKIKVGDEVELLGPHIKIEELERKENKSRYELYVNLK